MTPSESAVTRMSNDPWVLAYQTYVPEDEPLREALCTLGNGRFATGGATPEHPAECRGKQVGLTSGETRTFHRHDA